MSNEQMFRNGQPVVKVRRQFDREGYGVWFGEWSENVIRFAKPCNFVLEASKEGWMLPDPTFIIPRAQMKEFFESLSYELALEREPFINPHNIVSAKDDNLKDLRGVVDRLLSIETIRCQK